MKKLIVAGIILLALGLILGTLSFGLLGFRFHRLGTGEYETRTVELRGDFRSIRIQGDTEYITIRHAEESGARLVCLEPEKTRHTAAVEDGILNIRQMDGRRWFERFFSVSLKSPELVLYLPEDEYGELTIESSTGDIHIFGGFRFESIRAKCSTGDVTCEAWGESVEIETDTGDIAMSQLTAGDIRLKVSTGRTSLSQVRCASLESTGSTGDITLTHTVAAGSMTIRRSTGDVRFDSCDAFDIVVETDTGDVTGTLLRGKTFQAATDTGRVEVPPDEPGGVCEITTDTGDIRISIPE